MKIENEMSITAQKMKFSIKDYFSKYEQIRSLLKKSLMENFIFCAVYNKQGNQETTETRKAFHKPLI